MISLTYMKPRGLAIYLILSGGVSAFLLLGLGINLLGASFSMVYNYLFLMVSIALNVLVYIFCKSYTGTLTALTAAKNEAFQASQAKSSFLSNMSHEIRTPMNAIIGMTTIGMTATDLEHAQHALQRIDNASRHLLGIINDILDMSLIESGNCLLSPEEFCFDKFIQRVSDVISFRVADKEQNFTVTTSPQIPPFLIGDDQRLAQILVNLLGNAVKFTPQGGSIGLSADLLSEKEGVCHIRFAIVDTGIGISVEQQKGLFQPFHQAEAKTSRLYGGTGLGLSISRRLVEMMGGTIWLDSELGKGSTFAFTVLLQKGSEESRRSLKEQELSPMADSSCNLENVDNVTADFQGQWLLLADDVEVNREIALALLEPLNLHVDCVENGAQAVTIFSQAPEKYAMILMDIQMPEMDGYDATRAIRELPFPRAKTVPIIAMTANVFKEDIELCLAAGMNEHLGKPMDMKAVLHILRTYLPTEVATVVSDSDIDSGIYPRPGDLT